MPTVNPKLCQLQANNSGAWKGLGTFNAALTDDVQQIETGAEAIQSVCPGTKFRIVTADGLQTPLLHLENGVWKEAKHG